MSHAKVVEVAPDGSSAHAFTSKMTAVDWLMHMLDEPEAEVWLVTKDYFAACAPDNYLLHVHTE